MRIIPCAIIPFLYIAIFHLPLAFLGLTLNDAREQLAIGLLVGIIMAAFATVYRMVVVGSWFRWPPLNDHLLQGSYYFIIIVPVEELFFRGFVWAALR